MTDESTFIADVAAFTSTDIEPAATEWSLGQSPDDSLYHTASALGLTGMEVPVRHSGSGFGFKVKADACAQMAMADFGFAMSIVNTHNVAVRLCLSAADTLRDKYLPGLLNGTTKACTALTEPDTGSDFAAIKTRARKASGGWVLSGEKTWIVNGRHAGLAIVFAQTGSHGNSDGIAAFLINLTSPGVKRYPIDAGFSQTSIATGGFQLDNVETNDNNLLLPPGTAFKSILNEINGARVYVASMCNAMLQAAIQQVRRYGESRYSFGKPLSEHESWLRVVTEAESELATSRAIEAGACILVDQGGDAQLAAINAKVKSVDTCQHQLPRLLHAMGAEGLRPQYCFTRHLAAAQMAGLTDGATGLLRDRAIKLSQQQA